MSLTLKDLIEECEDTLDQYALERLDDESPEDIADAVLNESTNTLIEFSDMINEIADGAVPVYHSDLIEVAMSSIGSIATVEPELGPAFDGRPTPTNIIAANIYEALCTALWEYIESDEWQDHMVKYCEHNEITLDVGGPAHVNIKR